MRASVLLVTLLIATPATAAPSLEERYKAAVKLENAGSLVEALAAFEAIPVEKRDFNARLHIAGCKRKLGRMLEAARDYEAIRDDPKADIATKETADSDLDVVRAATPKLKVTLAKGTSDIAISIDGADALAPFERLVDPGSHAVLAKRAGVVVFERKVMLAESTTVDVVIDAPSAIVGPSAPPPTGAPPKAVDAGTSDWRRPTGFIVGGVGLAALGLGIWSALRVGTLESERDDLAAKGDSAAYDRASEARGAQTIGRVALATGVLALGVGTFLVLSSKSERVVANSVRIAPTAGVWGLRLEASW